jgi:hypothetical protein
VWLGGAVGLRVDGGVPACGVGVTPPGLPCWPAWLFPSLAALDRAAPLSTPVAVVLWARSDTSLPFPDDEAPGPPAVGSGETAGTGVVVPGVVCALGPGTVTPTLANMSLAVCCIAPGSTPAAAAPPLSTSPPARTAAAAR